MKICVTLPSGKINGINIPYLSPRAFFLTRVHTPLHIWLLSRTPAARRAGNHAGRRELSRARVQVGGRQPDRVRPREGRLRLGCGRVSIVVLGAFMAGAEAEVAYFCLHSSASLSVSIWLVSLLSPYVFSLYLSLSSLTRIYVSLPLFISLISHM